MAFVNDVGKAVDAIRLRLLGRSLPTELYHYTCFDTVLKIGNSRALRATCAADLGDTKEVKYGAELVQEQVERKVNSGAAEFPKMVLKLLHAALIDRKSWTFVACFCATHDSGFHRKKYGEYCLGFDTRSIWDPQLRPRSGLSADVQYYRAIYRQCVQREAIRRAIDSIAESALGSSGGGVIQGPWTESIAKFYARNAAQLLMDLITSFKTADFRKEKEWRIVCRPSLSLNSSAPDLEQDSFRHLVNIDRKHYIELQTPVPNRGVICAHSRAAVPFSSICRPDGFRHDDDERRDILQMLGQNDRLDIRLG
jgi:hypothetical protein